MPGVPTSNGTTVTTGNHPSWFNTYNSVYLFLADLSIDICYISTLYHYRVMTVPSVHHVIRSWPWFNIKMSSYQFRKPHCGDKTVVRSSYLHNWIPFNGKMASFFIEQPHEYHIKTKSSNTLTENGNLCCQQIYFQKYDRKNISL